MCFELLREDWSNEVLVADFIVLTGIFFLLTLLSSLLPPFADTSVSCSSETEVAVAVDSRKVPFRSVHY